jgi:hypothetical protein
MVVITIVTVIRRHFYIGSISFQTTFYHAAVVLVVKLVCLVHNYNSELSDPHCALLCKFTQFHEVYNVQKKAFSITQVTTTSSFLVGELL